MLLFVHKAPSRWRHAFLFYCVPLWQSAIKSYDAVFQSVDRRLFSSTHVSCIYLLLVLHVTCVPWTPQVRPSPAVELPPSRVEEYVRQEEVCHAREY